MKKITLLFAFIAVSVFAFAQNTLQFQQVEQTCELSKVENYSNEQLVHNFSKQTPFWSEDFGGDTLLPAGWTTVDNTGNDYVWVWSDTVPGGAFSINNQPFESTTAANGFVVLNSDSYNSIGDSVINPSYIDMDSYIQTPAIDCSGRPAIVLRFEQYFRWCCSPAAHLSAWISNDGFTWTEFDVRGATVTNDASPNPDIVEINISAIAANQPTVYIRWHKQDASHYYWMVDDIELIEAPDNDIILKHIYPEFKYLNGGFYNQTPKQQVMNIYFGADVYNFGNNDQTNITLNVQVDDFSSVVYDETGIPIASLASNASDSLAIDTLTPFLPPPIVKAYNATFTVSSDSIDENPTNNVDTITFSVSDTVYARDNGIITGKVSPCGYVDGGEDGDRFGVTYDINAIDTVSSMSAYIHKNTELGGTIFFKLFYFDPIIPDWVEILSSDIFDIIDSSDIDTWVTLPFILTGAEVLAEGSYMAAIEFYFYGLKIWIAEDTETPQEIWSTRWFLMTNPSWYAFSNYAKSPFIRLNFKSGTIPLTATITEVTDVSCYGGSDGSATVTASGGTPPYTYLWDDASSQTTDTASNLPAGNYSVIVTDSNLSTETAYVTITQPLTAVTITLDSTNHVSTPGGSDGAIYITVTDGLIPYTFLWSNDSTNQDIDSLASGWYFVTVTDYNLCTATQSIYVLETDTLCPITITIEVTNVSCNGGNDGSATVTPANGTPPYNYEWSNGQTDSTATNLSAGTYTVVVNDDSCTVFDYVIITEPALLTANITGSDVLCNGGNDGSADLTVTGGTISYDYSWSTTETTEDISGLSIGTYYVTVTDTNLCATTESVVIGEPAPLVTSIVGIDVLCNGGADGSADLTVTGGTIPYDYSWSTTETNEDISGLSIGTYYVTVTDGNLCTITNFITITEPDTISIQYTTTDAFSGGTGGGTVTANPTGGTPPYTTYVWSDGQTTQTATNLDAGTYIVTVTDANGCTGVNDAIEVQEIVCSLAAVINPASIQNVSCNGGNDGSATVVVITDGVPPYEYNWNDDPFQTTETAAALAAGINYVTVTDSMYCTSVASIDIGEPPPITITCGAGCVTDASSPVANDGSINIQVTGGTPFYSYLWAPGGETTQDISGLYPDMYYVQVTDANDCTAGIFIEVGIITSINEISNNDVINIYPNPTKGELYITNAENSTIYVFNIIGEVLISIDNAATVNTIDISSFAEGAYIVRIVSDKYVVTKKINLIK